VSSFKLNLIRLLRETEGQDLIEYALAFACIALAAIAGANGVAANVANMLITVSTRLTGNL
jgi:Flp pilus assembly pilin Flp